VALNHFTVPAAMIFASFLHAREHLRETLWQPAMAHSSREIRLSAVSSVVGVERLRAPNRAASR